MCSRCNAEASGLTAAGSALLPEAEAILKRADALSVRVREAVGESWSLVTQNACGGDGSQGLFLMQASSPGAIETTALTDTAGGRIAPLPPGRPGRCRVTVP